MCVININLSTTSPDGTTISSASGRYRLVGTTTWTNFSINLSSPSTPNITTLGNYDLQVNVTNNLGVTSDWAIGSFSITEDCGVQGPCNFDDTYYYYILTPCNPAYSPLNVRSPIQLTVGGVVYQPVGSNMFDRQGELTAIDCNQLGSILIDGTTNCPDNGGCLNFNIRNGTQSDLTFDYTPCGSNNSVSDFVGGFESVTICAEGPPSIETGLSISQIGSCESTTTTTSGGGTGGQTVSGTFSNGTSVTEGHSLPGTDPFSKTINGTLTVTGGPATYTLGVQNQFNYGNLGTAYLNISNIGSLTVSTDGQPFVKQANGSLTVPVGTYNYVLVATLDIIPTATSGAVTASIIPLQ